MKRHLLRYLLRKMSLFLLVGLASWIAAAQQSATVPATAAVASTVPKLINYSGVLKDASGKPLTGVLGVTFLLYRDQQGGAPLWMETQNVTPDRSGRFTVTLGATTSQGLPADVFAHGEARWLALQVVGEAEQPRVLLVAVPYALKAEDAETIGGLPPSAFVLAVPAGTGANSSANPPSVTTSSTPPPPASNVTTSGGTVNALPLWTTSTNVQSSVVSQTGTGSSAKVGIGTTAPGATLDVKGPANIQGVLTAPATGTATSSAGNPSQAHNFVASSFNSGTAAAVNQTFQWKAEPAGNNTATPSGTLNLLFGSGASNPTETGLKLSPKGLFTFAAGQTFPGTGTITGVKAGTDLTGGGTSGIVTVNLDTTKVPQLGIGNTFTQAQTINTNNSSGSLLATNTGQAIVGTETGNNFSTAAVVGQSTATGQGATIGVLGSAATNSGAGVQGTASGATSVGVFGTSAGSLGIGVEGIEDSANGIGVEGAANGSAGVGVFGTATNKGVWGTATIGVEGSTGTTGGMGVFGWSSGGIGYGVFGEADNQSGIGIQGVNNFGGWAVAGSGNNIGVYGASGAGSVIGLGNSHIGVWGDSDLYNGVVGSSDQAPGVYGVSDHASGVIGTSLNSNGVLGSASGTGAAGVRALGGPGGYGIYAVNTNTSGQGVWGETYGTQFSNGVGADAVHGLAHTTGGAGVAAINAASGGTGLYAATPDSSGDAGVFQGNVGVNGTLNAFSKNFKIDHPLDPTNKYLYHASVESSEMMTIYSGNVTTDSAGIAVVQLPGWFETLNTNFRYQLTVLGQFAQAIIAREIESHQFTIRSSQPTVKVSWQITAVRQDAFAKAHPLVVEVEKSARERGTYLDPKLYNAPMETGLSWARYRWPQGSAGPSNIPMPVLTKKEGATPVRPQLPAQLAQQPPVRIPAASAVAPQRGTPQK